MHGLVHETRLQYSCLACICMCVYATASEHRIEGTSGTSEMHASNEKAFSRLGTTASSSYPPIYFRHFVSLRYTCDTLPIHVSSNCNLMRVMRVYVSLEIMFTAKHTCFVCMDGMDEYLLVCLFVCPLLNLWIGASGHRTKALVEQAYTAPKVLHFSAFHYFDSWALTLYRFIIFTYLNEKNYSTALQSLHGYNYVVIYRQLPRQYDSGKTHSYIIIAAWRKFWKGKLCDCLVSIRKYTLNRMAITHLPCPASQEVFPGMLMQTECREQRESLEYPS